MLPAPCEACLPEPNPDSPAPRDSTRARIRAPRSRRLRSLLAALLIVVAWFGSLELRGLFIPDEGRYAEIPREMLASGDWITPRMDGLVYFEKPPLQYWLTAISYRIFGEDEWTARLPAALLGFLALLMVGYTGYRLWGGRAGLLAVAILSCSWGYFLAAQYLTLDMTVTACLSFALCSFLLAQNDNRTFARNRWMLAAWLAAALAVLSKGLIGVALPGISLAAYVALRRDTSVLRRLDPIAGSALFVLVALPWFIAVQYRNPGFFDFFFVHEQFQRFAEPGHNRAGAWWYYLPIALVGLMPWTPALLKDGTDWLKQRWHDRRSRSRQPAGGFSAQWFCLSWVGAIVLFFSASHSKLPAYILPIMPAVALMLAHRLQTRTLDGLRWPAWGCSVAGIALLALSPWLPMLRGFEAMGPEAIPSIPWLQGAAVALIATGAAALWSIRGRRTRTALAILVLGTLGFWNLVFAFLHQVDDHFSSERLIENLTGDRPPFHPELPFYSVGQFDSSVPFYLGRTVTLVATRGELGPGIDAEPSKAIPTIEGFDILWRVHAGQAYAILPPELFSELRDKGLPMNELMSDRRLVVVSRRPESAPTSLPPPAPARRDTAAGTGPSDARSSAGR